MIFKFESFEKNILDLQKNNCFLFHGSNIGKVDDCSSFIVNLKGQDDQKFERISIHSEELKKGDLYEFVRKYNQPNIFGNLVILSIYLNNEKINKDLISVLPQITNQNLTIILKSGQLSPRSTLRFFFEKEKNFIIVPCYEENKLEKIQLISQILKKENMNVSLSDIKILADKLPNQRLEIKNELEKIIVLHKNMKKELSIESILTYRAEWLEMDHTKFIDSIMLGKSDNFVKDYNKFTDFGSDNIKLVNYLLEHLFRILIVQNKIKEGINLQDAVKKLSPPIFFKYHDSFCKQVSFLKKEKINIMIKRLYKCKKSLIEGHPSSNYLFQITLLDFF